MFLEGRDDPNRWSRWDERTFVQEFLEFYTSEILDSIDDFHYETFYDYYSGYLYNDENKEDIERFCTEFNDRHMKDVEWSRDCNNRIRDFNRTFNQLLAQKLSRTQYFNDISTLNYPPYDAFLGFLSNILETFEIKVHSLNHDLLLDWLGRHHSNLWEHYCDGYQLEGSPYYGSVSYDFNPNSPEKVHKTYYVKLERFTNKFDKPLALFKLHGSIYNTIVYRPDSSGKTEYIRLKQNYGIYQFYQEVTDEETGEPKLAFMMDETAPDFLSGTTNKSRYYTQDPYYITLFDHFTKNLEGSELLIVIGYGFNDPGINEYLEKHYLSKGKKMVVIDPNKPSTSLLESYNTVHIPKGVTEVKFDEYMMLVNAK